MPPERDRRLRLRAPSWQRLREAPDAGIVTGRNLRHFWRQPQLLIFSTVQPIMFVLLFAYVFGGAIKGSLPAGVSYIDFLLPGIFVQSVAFRATQTAVGLSRTSSAAWSTGSGRCRWRARPCWSAARSPTWSGTSRSSA